MKRGGGGRVRREGRKVIDDMKDAEIRNDIGKRLSGPTTQWWWCLFGIDR